MAIDRAGACNATRTRVRPAKRPSKLPSPLAVGDHAGKPPTFRSKSDVEVQAQECQRGEELGQAKVTSPQSIVETIRTAYNTLGCAIVSVADGEIIACSMRSPASRLPQFPSDADRPGLFRHHVARGAPLMSRDIANEERFKNDPAVRAIGLRFFVSAPIEDAEGTVVATLSIFDDEPRTQFFLPHCDQLIKAINDASNFTEMYPKHCHNLNKTNEEAGQLSETPIPIAKVSLLASPAFPGVAASIRNLEAENVRRGSQPCTWSAPGQTASMFLNKTSILKFEPVIDMNAAPGVVTTM